MDGTNGTDGSGQPDAPHMEELMAAMDYWRTLLQAREADDESDEDEDEVEKVTDRIRGIFSDFEDLEAEAGNRPQDWSEDIVKKARTALMELCGILHAEQERFHTYYYTTLKAGRKEARRLSKIRKFVTTQFRLTCNTIIAAGLQRGVDITLACVALYTIRLLWSSILDPDYCGSIDTYGLGHLRLMFNQGAGMDYDRIVQIATNTDTLTGAHAIHRALATSILSTQLFTHVNEFVADKANVRALLARLNSLWLGGSTKSPKRPAARFTGRQGGVEPLQLPRSSSAGAAPVQNSPGAGPAAAQPGGGPGVTLAALGGVLANLASPRGGVNATATAAQHSPGAQRIVMPLRRTRGGAAASSSSFPSTPTTSTQDASQGTSAFVQSLPGRVADDVTPSGGDAGVAVADAAPATTAGRESGSKRPRDDAGDAATTPQGTAQQPPRRRRLNDRLRRATGIVQDNTLFPPGCNVNAPPPVNLHDLDTLGIISCMCVVATCQEVLAPVLSHSIIELLLLLLDPKDHKQRPRDIVVGGYNLISSLLIHKRCATVFVDAHGIEQVMQDPRKEIPILQAQLGALLQLSKLVSVLENVSSARAHLVPMVVDFSVTMLGLPCRELRKESALLLHNLFRIPTYVHAFDEKPDHLATLVNAIEEASKATDCSSGLESALCLGLMTYLQAHLLLAITGVWPSYKRHGRGAINVNKALPLSQVDMYLGHLEQPLYLCKENGPIPNKPPQLVRPDGSDTGFTLLTAARLPAFARVSELGVAGIVMQLLRAALRNTVSVTLDQVLALLETLAVAPFLRGLIATSSGTEAAGGPGLGLLLEVASEPFNEDGHQPQRHINLRALNVIRVLLTPPSYDGRTLPAYHESWRIFREYNGLRTLLLSIRNADHSFGDATAFVCTRILLVMSTDPTLCSFLAKLGLPVTLLNMIHAGPWADSTRNDFAQFEAAARLLVSMITGGGGKGAADEWAAASDMEHAVQRLEKARVVQNTNIHYAQRELQEIIHEYLVRQGLPHAAAALRLEAGLDKQLAEGAAAVARPGQRPLHNLDTIVQTFLRKQQMDCTNPVATLPTFSLRKGVQPALRVPEKRVNDFNIATRVRKAMLGHKTKIHASYDRKFIYSNIHRSSVIAKGDLHTSLGAIGFTADSQGVLVGNSSGSVVRHYGNDWHEWEEYDLGQDRITGLRVAQLTPHVCVWGDERIRLMCAENPEREKWSLTSIRAALFGNHDKSIMVGTSDSFSMACLIDIERGVMINNAFNNDARGGYVADNMLNVACTNYDDTMLLSDCILYDARSRGTIHRYDKLSQHTRGIFSTSQNEVIIDKWVWDIRTHKMLRTVPSLMQSFMERGPHGDVIFGARREILNDGADREPTAASTLSVVDGLTFDHISTLDMVDAIEDFAADSRGLSLGVILTRKAHGVPTESVAKVYHVGKQKLILEDDLDETEDEDDDPQGAEEEAEDEDSFTGDTPSDLVSIDDEEGWEEDDGTSSGVTIEELG